MSTGQGENSFFKRLLIAFVVILILWNVLIGDQYSDETHRVDRGCIDDSSCGEGFECNDLQMCVSVKKSENGE